MATVTAGLTTAAKVLIGQPIRRRDSLGNWSVTYTYAVSIATAYAQAPAHGAAIPAPEATDHPNLICTDVDIQDGKDGTNMILTVIYSEPSGSILTPGGSAIRSTRAAVLETLVDEVAGISSSDVEAAKAVGRRTKAQFTLSYHRRSVESSYTWSEANAISGLGKRNSPTDLSSPTANKWLKTERNATEQKASGPVELEEVWVYYENGWSTFLYGT